MFKQIKLIFLAALWSASCGDCGDEGAQDPPLQFGDWTPEVCDSGQDEDGDGRADCADSDCFSDSVCVFEPVVQPPELPLNGVLSLWERSRWFFEEGLIQRGLDAEIITEENIGTVRGKVLGVDGTPLVGASVSVAGRPDLGRTYTREDGVFDLAYAADARLVLRVSAEGYITSDRPLATRPQKATSLEEIVLVPFESDAKRVDFGATQLVMGSEREDDSGTRRTAAIFPKDVTASLVFPNGSRHELDSMHVRLTEVTVGDTGPQAMMAELPPQVLYTYAAEFTVDEAVESDAERVEFSKPVFIYVDNFLDFDAGTLVPSGFYDRQQTAWEPMPNGVVLDVLEISQGRAILSLGDGPLSADDQAALALTDEELRELAKMVEAGDSVWRVPTLHFSPFDFNWGGLYPPGTSSSPEPAETYPNSCSADQESGSMIGCSNQTLGEQIALQGTPFSLVYQSSRVSGRKPVIGVRVRPASDFDVIAARVNVTAAGQRLPEKEYLSMGEIPNVEEFIWDGKDGFGRAVQGSAEVEVEVALVYNAPYQASGGGERVWVALPTGVDEIPAPEFGSYAAEEGVNVELGRAFVVIRRKFTQILAEGTYDVAREGLGGWTLSAQHRYDPIGRVMYYGNGQDLVAGPDDRVLELISDGFDGESGWGMPDGTSARNVSLVGKSMDVGFDGTIYVAGDSQVRSIHPATSEITTRVGLVWPYTVDTDIEEFGDVGVATEAPFAYSIERLKVGRDGELYVLVGQTAWRLEGEQIRRLAGEWSQTETRDGEDALEVEARWHYLDATAEGILYLADEKRIFRRTLDGRLRSVAGAETSCDLGSSPCGDDGLASKAEFTFIRSIALTSQGELLVLEDITEPGLPGLESRSRIRKIRSDGWIETIAEIPHSYQLEVGVEDRIFFSTSDHTGAAVFQLLDDGEFVARAGVYAPDSDFGALFGRVKPLQEADRPLASTYGFALGPNSQIIFNQPSQIVRVAELFPSYTGANYQIPLPDGSAIDEFSPEGRHLASYDALTGAELGRFEYDDEGRLLKVYQRGDNITEIVRQDGNPQQIRGPDGVTWNLETRDGLLRELISPEGERWEFEYDDGLLTRMVNPRGEEWSFAYDEAGRLVEDRQPGGGTAVLDYDKDRSEVVFTSPAGRQSTYRKTPLGSPLRSESVETGDFLSSIRQLRDGWAESKSQDETQAKARAQSHPIYGMIARYPAEVIFTTPSGLRTEMSSEWVGSNATESLKDGLATFSHTLTHPRGQATTEWDRETLTLASESAERRTFEQVLDAQGRVVRMESGGFEPVDITYDARNRPVTITQGTRTQSLTYDSNGFVETITGADGTLRLNRDAMGRVLKTTRQDLSEIDFAYDLLGNLTDLTPPGRDAWTMSHDFRGQMLTLVTPLGSEETYLLDRDGRLVSATMADGREVGVTYDTSARVDRVVAAGKAYDYVYGEDAYLATVSGGDADVAFEWDGPLLTRQASSGAVSGDISWTWEDGTLALSTMNINGHDVDFTFDKDGMPVQVGPQAITYIRGSSLLREREIADVRITHAYNDFGELDDLRIRANGELFRVRYTHDDLGRITEARETILGTTTTWNYVYDLLGQLIEVRQDGAPYATYTYDENGNRTDIPGVVHNGDDHLLQYGDTSYTYNAAGQLAEKVRGAELTRYDYSVLGELEQVELPDGRALDYQHDAMQRRIGRQVDGVQTHRWLWGRAAGPVAEVDANGNTLTTFVYATGINVPDYMVRGAETFTLIRDHLGSVRFVVNTATNAIAQELRYDPFGEVLLDTNPGFQPFGYAGGLYDPETGLTRFGARDYDAHTGRWTARDPIAFGGGQTNLYVYVGNDPINFVDPSGSVAIHVVLGAIWGAIEFGLAVYDVYDFATTMMDSCSTTSDRLMSAGGVLAGGILPGGGYGAGAKFIHGNSKWSQRATHVYEIRDVRTWEVVKTGISSGKISKKGKSYRAESQRRRWGKEDYETTIIAEIPAGPGARQRALEIEKTNADGLRETNNLSDDFFHKVP